MNARQLLPRLMLLVGVAAAILWAVLNRDRLDLEALDAWLSGFGLLAPLAYLGLYAAGTIAFLPRLVNRLRGAGLDEPAAKRKFGAES